MMRMLPEHKSTTTAVHTQGRNRPAMSVRLWRRPAMPTRRRSSMAMDVMTMAMETMCTICTVGITQKISWMCSLKSVAANHRQNSRIIATSSNRLGPGTWCATTPVIVS